MMVQPRRFANIRTANIKENLPTVDEALAALRNELMSARHQGIKVVKIVHGYGSSGKGGAIKQERAFHRFMS